MVTRNTLLTALALAGCGGGDAAGSGAPPPTAELGTGEASFEPLEDGDSVPLIAGSQGGFHLWMSFRAHGFTGPRLEVTITTEVLADDGPHTRRSELPLRLDELEDGGLEFLGWPGVLDTTSCPVGAEARIAVTLVEDGNLTASDEKRVVVDGTVAFRLPPSCVEDR